ncbi:type II toxin-antitoxin system VapC family toxin (plasmid) [Rhizobium sp. WL3]|uniref:type II toxin-antitoxin system VapC family toxin n=1 Tax=Rhizobium sp. WL3 TaxID=2603277 RepID=UPI0011C1E4B4|nr:type II toxin-antitoxin system VapC family toxin [Rhizobium sp. WL3]QEE43764.1 type II toxin-antitoxin system VapC family toxin [Rhizobium sp. WL3]
MAYLNEESGAETAESWLDQEAAISALCVQETMANLVRNGIDRESAVELIGALGLDIYPLDLDLAIEGGALITVTQSKGLSHGDRACLSLARHLGLPAVTADRIWAEIADDVGVDVVLIR